jgi:hypothetical protein
VTIEFKVLQKEEPRSQDTFAEVKQLAQQFLEFLDSAEIRDQIAKVHRHGASSAEVQRVVMPGAQALHFTTEKKGLFKTYAVPALRPDYYREVRDTGILLEVERGKTTTNNMDILDFWKCHICERAEYLFLLVPQVRQSKNGSNTRSFNQVQNRLGTFFKPNNYVNVEAVFLFGY